MPARQTHQRVRPRALMQPTRFYSCAPTVPAPARALSREVDAADRYIVDPLIAAQAAQLRYVSDRTPGITRLRAGDGFLYRGPDRQTIRDPEVLLRIKSLRIPPAWTD